MGGLIVPTAARPLPFKVTFEYPTSSSAARSPPLSTISLPTIPPLPTISTIPPPHSIIFPPLSNISPPSSSICFV